MHEESVDTTIVLILKPCTATPNTFPTRGARTVYPNLQHMRRGEWWSKIVNNIRATRDHEIQDTLVFVYLDIHLAICQNLKYTNFMQSIFTWNVCC